MASQKPSEAHTKDSLDSMLDDALCAYEQLERQQPAPAPAETTPVAATTTATAAEHRLFPASDEDVEATLAAVMT
jgi:hypothetical protein